MPIHHYIGVPLLARIGFERPSASLVDAGYFVAMPPSPTSPPSLSYHLLEKHFLRLKSRLPDGADVEQLEKSASSWAGCAPSPSAIPTTRRVVMVLLHGFQMEPARSRAVRALDRRARLVPLSRGAARRRAARPRLVAHRRQAARRGAGARARATSPCSIRPICPAARARLLAFLLAACAPAGARPLVARRLLAGRHAHLRHALALASSRARRAWCCSRPRASPSTSGSRCSPRRACAACRCSSAHGDADADLAFSAGEALRDA